MNLYDMNVSVCEIHPGRTSGQEKERLFRALCAHAQ